MKALELINKQINFDAIIADLNGYNQVQNLAFDFSNKGGVYCNLRNFAGVAFFVEYSPIMTHLNVYARFYERFNGSTEQCHDVAGIIENAINANCQFVRVCATAMAIYDTIRGSELYDNGAYDICPSLDKIALPDEFKNWIVNN